MSDSKEYYDLLEISPTANDNEIKKAYRKMAIKYHPDKNQGNKEAEEMFKKIGEAYEILSDSEKRKIYDLHGKKGLSGNSHNMRPEDIFAQFFGNSFNSFDNLSNMFGNHFPFGNINQKTKMNNTITEVHITLDELYKGKNCKFNITRNIICTLCNGIGSPNKSNIQQCKTCKGTGMKTTIIQNGRMIQQINSLCDNCKGMKEIITVKCNMCKGLKVIPNKKQIELNIKPGTTNNEQFIFQNESDQSPNMISGDLIFILKQKQHHIFTRKQNNLYMKYDISLIDALTGTLFEINLFGTNIIVKIPENTIIKPNDILIAKNYGMPIKNSNKFGDLYIEFNIIFPTKLDQKQINILSECLNKISNNSKINLSDKIIYLEKK